jgi:hypothetical protein
VGRAGGGTWRKVRNEKNRKNLKFFSNLKSGFRFGQVNCDSALRLISRILKRKRIKEG